MTFEQEFKDAIGDLSEKEKDKLILRLLKHDLLLYNKLHFELVSTDTREERRAEMEVLIKKRVAQMSGMFHSIAYLLVNVRKVSGDISRHVKITTDKFGDASLNLLLLNEILHHNSKKISRSTHRKTDALAVYLIAKAFKLLIQIRAMHEDYLVEFKEGLLELGKSIQGNEVLSKAAKHQGLDLNWLLEGEIPEDIKKIQERLKGRGLLK